MAANKPCLVVIPNEEELTVSGSVGCLVDGCNRTFKSPSSRDMHIKRHHERQVLSRSDVTAIGNKVYYCPISGCSRSQALGQKPFKRLGHVKQHFNTVHKSTAFECEKCSKTFGMRDVYNRHMKECGVLFVCNTCQENFKSQNALYQHCKRSKHDYTRKRKDMIVPSSQNSLIIAPIIVKAVLPLPRIKTHATDKVPGNNDMGVVTSEMGMVTDTSNCVELATQTEYDFLTSLCAMDDKDVQTLSPTLTSGSCEFGTQTMPLLSDSTHWTHPFHDGDDISELFDTETIDFGTQTMFTEINNDDSTRDQGSQTLL